MPETRLALSRLALRRLFLAATALCLSLPLLASPATAQQAGCMNDIIPLREAVEKQGKALQGAIERKAERSEICTRVRGYAAAEGKFVKYLEENQSWCGVPDDAVKQVKANYSRTLDMRRQACAVAAAPPPPRGTGLSEALGTARTPPPAASGSGGGIGTYNTLTGNPFNR